MNNIFMTALTDVTYSISDNDYDYTEHTLKEKDTINIKEACLEILEGAVSISGELYGVIKTYSDSILEISCENLLILHNDGYMEIYDDSKIHVFNNSYIEFYDRSYIELNDESELHLYDCGYMNSYDGSFIKLCEESKIFVSIGSSLSIQDDSALMLYNMSSLDVYNNGTLRLISNKISLYDDSSINMSLSILDIQDKGIKLTYYEKSNKLQIKKLYKLTFEDQLFVKNRLRLTIDVIDKDGVPNGIFNINKKIDRLDISLSNLRRSSELIVSH